ncbi:Flp pilus assembly protein CpaB [Dyella agri]|uniref:Flp pilus assembly protein CpaB n=1 Tax=Dyella agri TaxID=1926869 RepID=A0ABW8KJL7_9GAMM
MQKITRMVALLLVLLAVVLAVLAIMLGRHTTGASRNVAGVATAAAETARAAQAQGMAVAVAATTLPPGVPIAPDALQLAQWPQHPAGAFADVASAAGGIPLVRIPAGTPVVASLLAHDLAMALRPGERAIAVPVDEQAGAGNRIRPGDYVDVFLSLKAAPGTDNGKASTDPTQTRLLLSRLRVLAYGDEDLPVPPHADDAKPADTGKSSAASRDGDAQRAAPHTAVLAVPVQDADHLLLGAQNGKLSLALRRPDDEGGPDHALFPPPRGVLVARSDLGAEQKQSLASPENRAYAGIDGVDLAGRASARPMPFAAGHRAVASQGVEVIRGTGSEAHGNRSNSP